MPLREIRSAKPRILLIDGDPQSGAALRSLLCAEGFHIVAPEVRASATAGPIDLVIADIAAGRGYRAAVARVARFESFESSAPVLVLVDHAAWSGIGFFDVANALGAAAILQRPFARAALLRSVDTVLSQSNVVRMAEDSWDVLRPESSESFLGNPRLV